MRKQLLIGLFLCFGIGDYCYAQTTIDFQVGLSASPELTFDWSSEISNKSDLSEPTNNLSIGVSSKLYKILYLRSEFGLKSANRFVEITYPGDPANGIVGDVKWRGWYENSRVYISFMPELRFLEGLVFVNGGFLYCRDVVNGFTNGDQSFNGNYTNFSDMGSISNNSTGLTFNFGVNPMYNNTGLIFGAGISKLSPVGISNGVPKIGIKMSYLIVGLNYKIN